MAARKKKVGRPPAPAQRARRKKSPRKVATRKAAKRLRARNAVKKVSKRTVKKVAKRVVKKIAKRAVVKAVKKVAKRPVKKVAKRATPKKVAVKKRLTAVQQLALAEVREAERLAEKRRKARREAYARKKAAEAEAERLAARRRQARREAYARKKEAEATAKAEAERLDAERRAARAKRRAERAKQRAEDEALGLYRVNRHGIPVVTRPGPRLHTGKWSNTTQLAADNLRIILNNLVAVLEQRGYRARMSVKANDDNTVDCELQFAVPINQASYDEIAAGVLTCDEVLYDKRKLFPVKTHISTGWKLPPEAQTTRARFNEPYAKYEGVLRVGTSYQLVHLMRSENIQASLKMLRSSSQERGILIRHELPPQAYILRLAWAEDGTLHRRR